MTTQISENTIELTERLQDGMHELYKHLHANPELSMQEFATADFVAAKLSALGIENFRCGGTGVVGVLENGEGPVVGFRADMDGLPIQEDTGLQYASTAQGKLADGTVVPVMHGCGHDTHIAAALTAAELLAGSKKMWAGTVVFIFQPGEETAAGAKAMVEDGLWDKAPKPEVIFGQHVMPYEAGSIQVTQGAAMAMADSWKVTVYGRQAHGSQPQAAIDPIVLAAHIVVRLQTIVSREVDPMERAVITVGTIHGGLKENIIPGHCEFTINVRTLTQAVRDEVLAAIRRIIQGEAATSGAPQPSIEESYTFPLNHNDPDATKKLVSEFESLLGREKVSEVAPSMGSEDFGELAVAIGVPSVFWTFGGYTADQLGKQTPLAGNHSPGFAPAMEPTLTTGVKAAMAGILSRVGAQRSE